MSLVLSFMMITTIYPFHNLADCLINGPDRWTCSEKTSIFGKRGNITHSILQLEDTIWTTAAKVSQDLFEGAHVCIRQRDFSTTSVNDTLLIEAVHK